MAEAVTITQWEMARFMDALGFDEADPGHPCGEVCYEAPYGTQGCRLRVYSTIANDGASRGVGADAIRVVCVDPEGDVFLKPFKRVHRVVNWRRNLLSLPTRRATDGRSRWTATAAGASSRCALGATARSWVARRFRSVAGRSLCRRWVHDFRRSGPHCPRAVAELHGLVGVP